MIYSPPPKVGDTLTATVTGAAAAKYEWSLNGTVMATTATYEVPASAKDGDEIKLTVTAEDGETASDTVYVGGLTILKVEPLAQGATYKYVKAYFSKALDSLSPSEIEIRGKKDKKLYSIQTAVLASDGMAADLTLYGNTDSDSTTFLRANTTYVMTLTQDGQSTSLEFELPAYATDKIVTSVDMGKNTITTDYSGKTGEAGEDGTFNVAGKFTGNLGSLIGRTVNYQYDTDNNLTAFDVDDAEVVYGAMKFVNDYDDLEKAYFKDALTGETYKVNRTAATASKNLTWFYAAEDGDPINPTAGTTYNYTKLVLNPDGTVSTANLVQNFAQNLFVTEVDGTKAIQDKNNAFDLDGYIIVKDDEYIAPADLELGDVVFVNTGLKFADVYTNELSGELSNVISGKLDIDGTTYNWDGAQYYDEDDDVYKTLSTTADEASQAYLNSLDTETDTTIWIARNKTIKYLDGTVVGQKKYTYATNLVAKTAQPYKESLKNKFNVDVFDGSATSTLTFDLSNLKFYKGVAGKYEAKVDTNWGDNTKANYNVFTFTGTNDASEDGDVNITTELAKGSLVKFMFDEDGVIVGLSNDEDTEDAVLGTSSLDGTNALGATNSPNLKADSSKFVQDKAVTATGVYTMGSYTNLWIWNEQDDETNPSDKFTKTALTDFENEIETDNASPFKGITYRVDGTKVTDLVVNIANKTAYAAAETNTIAGVIDDITYKNDSTDTNQIVNTITIYGTDGKKAKYTADGTLAAIAGGGYKKGSYVTLIQDKTTEKITGATLTADWSMATDAPTDTLATAHATTAFHNDKLILSDGTTELTTVSGGAILKRYQKEGSWKYDVVDYTDVNVLDGDVDVWYNTTQVSKDGSKIQSDMIVVEVDENNTPAPVTNAITIAATKGIDAVATTVSTKAGNTLKATYAGAEEIATVQWYVNNTVVSGATKVKATLADLGDPDDSDTVFVRMTDTEGTVYNSDIYTFEDPVLTTITTTSPTVPTIVSTTATAAGNPGFKDQFGEDFALTVVGTTAMTVAGTGTPDCTGTIAITAGGIATFTLTDGTTGVPTGFTYADTDNGLTWTLTAPSGLTSGDVDGTWTLTVAID